jgi:ketosteroid isomerase-like protein
MFELQHMPTRSLLARIVVVAVAVVAGGCGQALAATDALQAQEARRALYAYFDAYVAQDRDSLRRLTTDDFELIENGYPMNFSRFTETMDVKKPGTEKYAFNDLQIEVIGDIALFRYRLTWSNGDKTTFSGIETGFARRLKGRWLLARFHGTWLPLRASIKPDQLADYAGTYGNNPNGYHIVLERSALYAERIDRKAWSSDVRRVELIPTGRDEFVLEFDETPVKFDRDAAGRVFAVGLPAMEGSRMTRFAKSAK